METKSVKSIPKDFSEANQSMETESVKSIPKDFSKAKPVNGDNPSMETPRQYRQPVNGDNP